LLSTHGATFAINAWGEQEPLEGVELCQNGTPNCEMTDANGTATIQAPVGREISFTLTKEEYLPLLIPDVVPKEGLRNTPDMRSERWAGEQHGHVDSPYPMRGTGTIQVELQPGLAGATFELAGATGTPFYYTRQNTWSPDFITTTGRGWGGFSEVGPGDDYLIELDGEAENCVPNWGWPGEDENSIRVPVREGYLTIATVQCPARPFAGSVLLVVTERRDKEVRWGPLEGAEVCETDTTNCVISDAGGLARLELPVNQEVSFVIKKDEYEPTLEVDVTDRDYGSSRDTHVVWPDELQAPWYESAMVEYPQAGVGTVWVSLVPPLSGATFELIGAEGKAFYAAEGGPSFDLTATTSKGWGGFLEVSPGEFQIELGGTASDCKPWRAWPGDSENRIRFLVRDGAATSLTVDCRTP
jgi:hypothetical protein